MAPRLSRAWRLAAAVAFAAPFAAGAELLGRVTAVRAGAEVQLAVEGELLPVPGDPVTISFELPGGGSIPVGRWKVTRVEGDAVVASVVEATGTPAAGQRAVIASARPARRAAAALPGAASLPPMPALSGPPTAYVGVDVVSLNAHLRRSLDVPTFEGGVLVRRLEPAGPAASVLQVGDVIRSADGRSITDATALAGAVAAGRPGGPMALEVWRAGRPLDLTLTRGDRFQQQAQSCAEGRSASACDALARVLQTGLGGAPADPAAAAALHARAAAIARRDCSAGDAASCADLGSHHAHGLGVARDEARAFAYWRQACDGGAASACAQVARLYSEGQIVAKDEPRAAELFQRACDAGEAWACARLGFAYEHGLGVVADLPRAVALWTLACDGGDADGCSNLGAMLHGGRGIAQDRPRALRLLEQACPAAPNACRNLGWIWEHGEGVPASLPKAASYYEQACRSGEPRGCPAAGDILLEGRGVVKKDKARARELFRIACQAGQQDACAKAR